MAMKVMTVVGTRPEIIKLSRVTAKLDTHVDHVLVHTGQNFDYELNEIFFQQLKIRRPDHFLDAAGKTAAETIGNVIAKAGILMSQENPDVLLVLGDTNSCLSAIPAKRQKIPIFHMEAGNRCFDLNVPEEINRKIIDHISDFNLVYTEHARRNLLLEGLPHRRIYLTGSPMKEVLTEHMENIKASKILQKLNLKKGEYFLVSVHREENVDNSENLLSLAKTFEVLCREHSCPVIVSTHPRTRKRIEKLGRKFDSNIRFLKPFGFFEYVNLQTNAKCVISDSGTISEEASILSFPAVTIRNSMERPEAMDCGQIILTGLEPEPIIAAIKFQIYEKKYNVKRCIPDEYKIEDVSSRVVKLILGTSRLSHLWDNIRLNDLA